MKNRYFFMFKSLCVLILFIGTVASAQNVQITGSAFPGPAATSCTNTMLDVNVLLLCINAVHQGNTVNVVGSTITVDIDYTLGPICLGAISMVQQNISLGLIPAGSYSVTINGRLNAATVSTSATNLTVINCCSAVPSFVTSNDTVCVGDSVFFTNSSVGTTSRQWYVNNTSVSTSTNYGGIYNSPGTYAVKLVVSNGTCSDSITKNILVSAPPVVNLGPTVNLCPNSSVTLDADAGRDSVRWSNNATSQTISINTPGTYYVDVYKNGCTNRDSVTVGLFTVVPVSLGKDTVLCIGDSLVLSAQQTGATYIWQDASTKSTFKVLAAGTYYVSRTGANGCISRDTLSVIYDTCFAGVTELALESSISIFPNPASDIITVTSSAGYNTAYTISIYDLLGKLVKSKSVKVESGQGTTISIDDLKSGMYSIMISDESTNSLQTFIKKLKIF